MSIPLHYTVILILGPAQEEQSDGHPRWAREFVGSKLVRVKEFSCRAL